MPTLLAGLILFFGVHTVPMYPAQRERLVERIGSIGYSIAFGVVSLIGLILIARGYSSFAAGVGNPQLWVPPVWTQHIALLLMLPAMIAIVAAYVPSRVRNILKHPMLVAIKLWALAHLLANGDLASLLLFGTFLAWAVFDRISVKRRAALGPLGEAQGGLIGDLIAIGAGTALYAAFLFFLHNWLFGVWPLPALAS
ncbi:MAG: NnrU family protein [Pseudomonadota bacterium]